MERREGKGVLFVFDGFDEFPTELREKSLVTDIISGSIYLPGATVLVTSRPSATAQLQSLFQTGIGKRIEIVGFSDKEIHEYAESVLGYRSETLANFKSYILVCKSSNEHYDVQSPELCYCCGGVSGNL